MGLSAPIFIENKGQFDERVKFRVVGNGASLWLTKEGIVFDFLRAEKLAPKATPLVSHKGPAADQESTRIIFAQKFVAGDSGGQIEAKDPLPGTYNYFIGSDASKWVTHVRAYREIVYRDIWHGIDVKLAGNGRNLEEELIVHPGADLNQAKLAYDGIRGLSVAKDGSLKIRTDFGEMTETAPRLYQDLAGRRVPVKGKFKIYGHDTYAFAAELHRNTAALVVDPTLLYSTFLGGSSGVSCGNPPFGGCGLSENATGIAVDAAGSAYITGVTASSDFPVSTGALQTTSAADCCAFVTKLSPLGDHLEYSTFVGGTNFSGATSNAVAVNVSGEAYITGFAGTGFPITTNALEPSFNGGIFFLKLSAQGDALLYSTQIGRASIGLARGNAIVVDSSGKAYIAGSVDNGYSLDVTPTAFQASFPPQAAQVAFLSIIDPMQSGRGSLFYSTYLGASGADNALGVAVDSFGMVYLTGFANDPLFPVTPGAYQTIYAGGVDAFVAKINPQASAAASLIYSTYLGGPNEDLGQAIGADSLGNAYIVGFTNSGLNSPPFPTTPGALQTTYPGGGNSGFVTKLNPAGSHLVYSTYHGGFQGAPTSVAVDALGNAYVAGLTSGNFPVTPNAFQPVFHGGNLFRASDAFVSKFDPDGTLLYSTFLGGAGGDGANG
ncbi:MAG: SBBP repeat-containing protein, partial [Candidatus Angelobacter sp.]